MFSFSVKLFLTNVFTQINTNIFSVLLGRFYDARQVGFYSQGNKWQGMGNTFISGMINSVAQPVLVSVGMTCAGKGMCLGKWSVLAPLYPFL